MQPIPSGKYGHRWHNSREPCWLLSKTSGEHNASPLPPQRNTAKYIQMHLLPDSQGVVQCTHTPKWVSLERSGTDSAITDGTSKIICAMRTIHQVSNYVTAKTNLLSKTCYQATPILLYEVESRETSAPPQKNPPSKHKTNVPFFIVKSEQL